MGFSAYNAALVEPSQPLMPLAFFPKSLPNETVNSRIARYHLLSGNSSPSTTLKELGIAPNFTDQIVPTFLEDLAEALPGEAQDNFKTLLIENTLFPLFKPFLGLRSQDGKADRVSRFPRRVSGKHRITNLCPACVSEAAAEYGIGYFLRPHQAPGVTTCWKHGIALLSSCPTCNLPFERRGKCLTAPWEPCENCGLEISSAPQRATSENEWSYAKYVNGLIELDLQPVEAHLLASVYRSAIQDLGYRRGSITSEGSDGMRVRQTAMNKFSDDLQDVFGTEFISKIDKAFADGRTTYWLRFSVIDGVLDMPLPRHVLLGMRIFKTPERFASAISRAQRKNPALSVESSSAPTKNKSGTRDEHRSKIVMLLKRHPTARLENLWEKSARATAWLYEHDRKWLFANLDGKRNDERSLEADSIIAKDSLYARRLVEVTRAMVAAPGRPKRITLGRLLGGISVSYDAYQRRRESMPLLTEQLDLSRESTWSWRARRLLWAAAETHELGLAPTWSTIASLSAVSAYAVSRIHQFTGWDLEHLVRKDLNAGVELRRAGISLLWLGPSSASAASFGGRSYKLKSALRGSRDTSILDAASKLALNVPEKLIGEPRR